RPGSNSLDLAWTATGDDGAEGTASRYELRVAPHAFGPIDFESGRLVPAPRPAPAGERQTWHVTGLDVRTHYWAALRARDAFRNSGPVSNVVDDVTLEPPRISLSATELSASSTTGNVVRQAIELANDSP